MPISHRKDDFSPKAKLNCRATTNPYRDSVVLSKGMYASTGARAGEVIDEACFSPSMSKFDLRLREIQTVCLSAEHLRTHETSHFELHCNLSQT